MQISLARAVPRLFLLSLRASVIHQVRIVGDVPDKIVYCPPVAGKVSRYRYGFLKQMKSAG
ncbi:hypothetical protein AT05_01265 [Schleiferia thermophila str. Yellowstone]|nr:hypothetical protein AT05_01265 [Schleiferia thermophila str. Yellowstone]